MANYNKVFLIGNLTKDPEVSYTESQTAVCRVSLATNRNWISQDGIKKEEVCYINCTAFGVMADTLNQYMKKGMPIFIEGRLNYNTWTDQNGSKRSNLKVIIEKFEFLPSSKSEDDHPIEDHNEKDIIPF